jgi:hypothetical protein
MRTLAIVVCTLLGAAFFSESAICQADHPDSSRPLSQIGFPWDWSHESRVGSALGLLGALTAVQLPTAHTALQEPHQRVPVPYDWSHHHVKFSAPSNAVQARKLQQDPRYWHQKLRMNPAYRTAENAPDGRGELLRLMKLPEPRQFGGPKDSNGKWPELGPPWGHRPLLVFYSLAILTSLALLVAIRRHPAAFRRLIVAWWTTAGLLATSAGVLTSCNSGVQVPNTLGALREASSVPNKNNLPNELHTDWAFSMSSLAAGTATTGSATTFPAKFSFDVTAAPDCVNDYVAFNTSLPGVSGEGGSGTPNIIALNQLYTSQAGGSPAGYCGTAGPSVMWSYFTGTGSVQTSVVISGLGDKVAFIETNSTGAVLRILRGVTGEGTTITSPQTPTNSYVNTTVGASGNTAWNTTSCPNSQSCVISVPFSSGDQDANSSPFYDYPTDTLYVGDGSGVLHKFSGIFLGTPGEVVTGGWPITVDAGTALASPVLDLSSGNIFVGDSAGTIWYIREAGSSSGSCASGTPPCLGSTDIALSGSVVDGPMVDSTSEHVFWFDGTDTVNHGEVVQTDTALDNGVTLAGVGGTTSAGSPMFDGDFDNTYYSSSANSISGFLYFCGKDPTIVDAPALWRVGFNSAGVMNATPDGGLIAYRTLVYSAQIMNPPNVQCSPVTEFYNTNTSTDWIFLSVANLNWPCNGQTACVMSLDLNGLTSWPPIGTEGNGNTGMTAFSDVSTGGTSGIIIDNDALTTSGNFPQASSIYFSWLAPAGPSLIGGQGSTFQCNSATTGGCFQKLTQNGLQ